LPSSIDWPPACSANTAAVGHSILVIRHLLDHGHPYRDLGASYFDAHAEPSLTDHLVKRLRDLGDEVQLQSSTT